MTPNDMPRHVAFNPKGRVARRRGVIVYTVSPHQVSLKKKSDS